MVTNTVSVWVLVGRRAGITWYGFDHGDHATGEPHVGMSRWADQAQTFTTPSKAGDAAARLNGSGIGVSFTVEKASLTLPT